MTGDAALDFDTIVDEAATLVERTTGVGVDKGARRLLRTWARANPAQIEAALSRGWDRGRFLSAAADVLMHAAQTRRDRQEKPKGIIGFDIPFLPKPFAFGKLAVDAVAASDSMRSKCPFYGFEC